MISESDAEISIKHNIPEYSVSDISNILKLTIEDRFGYIRIRGEVSGLKIAPSGHVYLSLKDDKALISAVCWRGVYAGIKHKLQDGLEFICTGSLTTYAGQSKYQLIIQSIEPAGQGALMLMFEKLKKKLHEQGLFDDKNKKPLPFLPKKIGIITSEKGAVIRDMLHRIKDRFPVHVMLWPVMVQGDKAKDQIANAIKGFNRFEDSNKPDLLIVARGGGSIEDLWAFNEEIVVMAIADSNIPIISAVGHETDYSLSDFAADLRAPTPTAAAELALPVKNEILIKISTIYARINNDIERLLKEKKSKLVLIHNAIPKLNSLLNNYVNKLDDLSERLSLSLPRFFEVKHNTLNNIGLRLISPKDIIKSNKQNLDNNKQNLKQTIITILKEKRAKLEMAFKLLESFSYKKVLERGFAVVRDNNNLVSSSKMLKENSQVSLEFSDGTVNLSQIKLDYKNEN